jgi:type 1 glutamine amidotransferase/HEAT repeat protein
MHTTHQALLVIRLDIPVFWPQRGSISTDDWFRANYLLRIDTSGRIGQTFGNHRVPDEEKRFMLWKQRNVFCCVALAVLAVPVFGQAPDEIQKIKDALPKAASVKPAKPRKLLVFSLATGFKHDSIPYGEKAFELMGQVTGAYEATLSKDMAVFEPASLKQFDAILMNNTTGELFTTPSLQQSLIDFVKSGKGFAGIHSASDCCYTWPSYGDMIGGYFDGHPWTADSKVSIRIDDPKHPVAKAFGGAGFDITDEIYQFKDPYSRHKLRVLTSLDNDKTDMNRKGLKRAEKDFAISWVRKFGNGRVFYCSLGHNKHIFHDARVLQHYLDGIQFVLGDLKADAEPIAASALEMQNRSFDAAEAGLKNYDYGKAEPASAIFDSLERGTNGATNARRAFVARLVAVATNPEYSVAARELTLRRIPYCAVESDVPKLFPLLKDENAKIAEMTRYALAPIPGASVSKAFRDTAAGSTNETLIAGLINALGSRKDKESTKFLVGYTENSSPVVAAAAIAALGKVGTQDSAAALRRIFDKGDEQTKSRVGAALAECAGGLAANGNRQAARSIYESLMKERGPYTFRLAAFTGYANLSPNASDVALKSLLGDDRELHSAAGTMLTASTDAALNQKLAAAIKAQKPETQVALLGIAQSRQAKQAMAPARELLSSETTATRSAAIEALGKLGDESVMPDLLKIAANKGDEFREQARASIDQIATAGVDELLISLIDPSKEAAVAETDEAIQAIGRRKVEAAVPVLLENAKTRQDDTLKTESYNVLANIARAEDAKALLDMNFQITSQRVRTKAELALLAAIRKMQPVEAQSAFLVDAIERAPTSEARVSILKLLGKLGDANSYKALKKFLASEDKSIKDTAIRALADFSTPRPINDLVTIARDDSAEQVHRVLALRGAARMIGLESKRKRDKTLQFAETLLKLASTDEDKKLVISSLAEVKQPGIIELVVPSLDNPAVATETSATILKLAPDLWAYSPRETSKTLTKILEGGLNEDQAKELQKLGKKMAELTTAVVAWQVAGPYSDPAAQEMDMLLAHKFEPETGGADKVEWKAAAAGTDANSPELVDVEKAIGGSKNSAAYLRTFLLADSETTASLRIGSDDGIVVWLNGQEVLSSPVKRGYKEPASAVQVPLKQGRNELMAKVINGVGQWNASVIAESTDGAALDGVTAVAFPRE